MGVVLVAGVIAVFAAGALVAIPVLRMRHLLASREEAKRTQLASECFSGLPEVVVAPWSWQLTDHDIRTMAARRGYREVPPPAPRVLAFRHEPHAVPQPTHHGTQDARDRVAAELSAHGFAWLTLSEVGGTVADVVAFTARHGARMLRQYGDHLDPMLLVGTRPIGSLQDLIPTGTRAPLTSRKRIYARGGVNVAAAVAIAVMLPLGLDNSIGVWFVLAVVIAIGADTAAFLLFTGRGSTTERMTRLLREFNGDATKVVIVKRHFRLDRLTILDIAAEFGYANWQLGVHRPTTRWYEECLFFEPRPDTMSAVGHRA